MEGTIGTIKWVFDGETLIFEPVDGKEGTCRKSLLSAISGLSRVTEKVKTKGQLHFIGKSLEGAFSGFEKLKIADLSAFEASQVTNMNGMFRRCISLEQVNLSSFDTSSVQNMNSMFAGCQSLKTLDLSNFDTQNVEYVIGMFSNCIKISGLDLHHFNTSKIISTASMFNDCSSLVNIDLPSFDTSNIVDMSYMFSCCSSLTELDLSNFDTSNVKDMQGMFYCCSSLTSLDLSNFDTSKVKDMQCMFAGCSSLTNLDLSNFRTDNVRSFNNMFSKCFNLRELDISNFCFNKSPYVFAMFSSAGLSTLNMKNIKSDIDFCLTELPKSPCHLIVPKEIEEIAKRITNPSILTLINRTDDGFNKPFVKKVLTALDTVTQLDFKNDLAELKKTYKRDCGLALHKAMELTQNKGYNDLSGISTILKKYYVTAETVKGLDQKQVIDLFNKTGLTSDINAYLNGVPLEDILV